MYQLKFKLKQHTPIIHFQHDQEGATLRATEVKPKLDRFLVEKLGGIEKSKREHPHWFQGDFSLRYKMKLVKNKEFLNTKIEKNYPNYLGNMGNTFDAKGFLIFDEVDLTFLVYDLELKEFIDKNISLFLVSINFGNRTSKGFGGFYIKEYDLQKFEKDLLENFGIVYKMVWNNANLKLENDHKYLFRKIQDEYKLLKSGDSRNKKESKLRQYVNNMASPIEWEKPLIQSDIQKITGRNLNINWKNKNFFYVRALLGLADHYDYIKQNITVSITPKNKEFHRFASPLLFKVYDKFLYLTYLKKNNIDNVYGEKVKINYKKDGKALNNIENELKIPDINFKINDFLEFALKNTQWRKLTIN